MKEVNVMANVRGFLRASPVSQNGGVSAMRKYGLIFVATLALMGWKSAPIQTELSSVAANPNEFNKKEITISATVAENSVPQGHEYKTWSFVLGSSNRRLSVAESGFNPATIVRAHDLVEKARLAGDAITVTGKLKATKSGTTLQLVSVRYGDVQINTDEGPFVKTAYGDCYPRSPIIYDGYTYYPGNFPY